MSITGELEKTDDSAFAGWIASLTFDVDVSLTPNGHKSRDTHPDFVINAQSPRGRSIRVCSGWIASLTFDVDVSLTANPHKARDAYLSLAIKREDGTVWGLVEWAG